MCNIKTIHQTENASADWGSSYLMEKLVSEGK